MSRLKLLLTHSTQLDQLDRADLMSRRPRDDAYDWCGRDARAGRLEVHDLRVEGERLASNSLIASLSWIDFLPLLPRIWRKGS
jgi:hypothetical protein